MKINWMGCKKRLIPTLLPLIPKDYRIYYEPFLGSGAVYLALKPKIAVLNDNDPNIFELWKYALNSPLVFSKQVEYFEQFIYMHTNQSEQKHAYQQLLLQFNALKSSLIKSAAFFVLVKYAFRGITCYRNNKLKVCFGYREKFKNKLIDLEMLTTIKDKFQINSKLFNCDFTKIIASSQKNDFLFIDPPYYYEQPKKTVGFYYQDFTLADHQCLFNTLLDAHRRGVKWLYTNYDTPTICELFKEFNITKINTTTGHFFANKNIKNEVIIRNYTINN